MIKLQFILAILSAVSAGNIGGNNAESVEVFRADFEEGSDLNYDAWPDDWTRRRGRGYPAYIPIEIVEDEDPAQPDNQCLRFGMDGGGAQIFAPSIAIRPQFSYLLEARVRTADLKHDAVSFSVTFYDSEDKLLEVHESEVIRQSPQWTTVCLGPITSATDRAHTAIVSAHVKPTTAADLSARVFIDDLRFARLPRMSVETNSDCGIYTDPQDVTVMCRVSGFSQPNPVITFELLDVDGQRLESSLLTMPCDDGSNKIRRTSSTADSLELGFAGRLLWKPSIPDFGFYTIRISTAEHSGLKRNIVVVPPLERRKNGEFGWSLPNGEQPLSMKILPSLLSHAGVHWAKFPVWFTANENKRAEELATFAERLSSSDIQLVGVLDQPPQQVRDFFGDTDRMAIASIFEDKAIWHPAVDPVMSRLSLKVQWWQLGRDSDTSFSSYANVDDKIREIREDLTSFGQRVNVGVPWRTIEEPPNVANPSWSFLSYYDPLPLTDAEVHSYLGTPDTSASKRWIVLQPLSKRKYDTETRGRDLILRMLAAKISNAQGIFIPNPFDEDEGVMNSDGSPGEMLLPWRTTATLIGGCEYLGVMKLPMASNNHVFVRGSEGVMVLWNDQPETEVVFLGDQIKLYDIWGRQSTPRQRTDGEFTRHEIPVGPMPTFVTGVNPAIAKWSMNFRFETTSLTNEFGREQSVAYRFKNTFPQGMGGLITIHTPDAWRTDASSRQFRLSPEEEVHDTLRVVLGPDSSTGKQPIRVDFELTAEKNLQFSVAESLQVGLGHVVVELDTHLDDQGNLIVEQQLTNNLDKPVSFNCMLFAPGRRRDKRQIFNLGRGRTTNVFVLPKGQELLGKTLWIRAEEIGGARILNDRIVAHE